VAMLSASVIPIRSTWLCRRDGGEDGGRGVLAKIPQLP
jgi:hypothetical protein